DRFSAAAQAGFSGTWRPQCGPGSVLLSSVCFRRGWSMRRSPTGLGFSITMTFLALLGAGPTLGSDPPGTSATQHPGPASPSSPLGFCPHSSEVQLRAEATALTVPTPENARNWLRILTAEPHVAGTPADYKTAVFVRDKLREWGWKADLVEFEVLLNYPSHGAHPDLNLRRPYDKKLPTDEAPIASDKDSASSDAFGAFNGYGTSGTAWGQVIYANYGRPDDYTALEKMGIELKDKVVLVRYGEIFRGLKVYNAQKRGARGILIFSDPAD